MRKKNDMKKPTKKKTDISRRKFIGAAAAATSAFSIVPSHVLAGRNAACPSDTINLAVVGCGSHSKFLVPGIMRENGYNVNMVALCDVDTKGPYLEVDRFNGKTYTGLYTLDAFKNIPKYVDYQTMLQEKGGDIDGVIVATPDHQHMPVSIAAMNRNINVYCEKDLGVNVHEVRLATQIAKKKGIVTQMGIGNHQRQELRRIEKAVKVDKVIGQVRKVHIWCDNEYHEANDRNNPTWPPRNVGNGYYDIFDSDAVLDASGTFDGNWQAWLGPATPRPYNTQYHPRGWRNWWDFGGGRLGDIGCHSFDWLFSALDLEYPHTVEAWGNREPGLERAADVLNVKYQFPAREGMDPVEVNWYDGNSRPGYDGNPMPDNEDNDWIKKIQLKLAKDYTTNHKSVTSWDQLNDPSGPKEGDGWARAMMLIGTEGILVAAFHPTRWELFPLEEGGTKFDHWDKAKYTSNEGLPNHAGSHYEQWLEGIKTCDPSKTNCGFDYAGPLSETVLLGIAAYRTGKKLEWDPRNLKAIGTPEADQFLKGEYRAGWALPSPVLPDNNYPADREHKLKDSQ